MPKITADLPVLPPPPRKGDQLFRDDLPDHSNASAQGEQAEYSEGYRRGARVLVEHVLKNPQDRDFLVFPIIFLYRHHIELALKKIIMLAPYLIDRELTKFEQDNLDQHRLDRLWRDLKPMFAAIYEALGWPAPEPVDIEGIDDYIAQISRVDPRSDAFRYSYSKKRKPSLPVELRWINLRNFAELIERLAHYFEGIEMAAQELADFKGEQEADYRNEMFWLGGNE